MKKRALTYGVLVEVIEDWTKRRLVKNRLYVHILEKGKLVTVILVGGIHYTHSTKSIDLLCKKIGEIDIHDDDGNLLNGESPKDMHNDIIKINDYNLLSTTPVGVEIWFDDPSEEGGEIQYNIESHNYLIENDRLILQYDFDNQNPDIHNNEFKILLKNQYIPIKVQ